MKAIQCLILLLTACGKPLAPVEVQSDRKINVTLGNATRPVANSFTYYLVPGTYKLCFSTYSQVNAGEATTVTIGNFHRKLVLSNRPELCNTLICTPDYEIIIQ